MRGGWGTSLKQTLDTRALDTRARILAAAEELSCDVGPARVSLEAVAAKAGVSKGGLLYHFRTKHDLLRALVARHVEGLECALAAEAAAGGSPLAQARAYLRAVRKKLDETRAPPGFFAAIAEDPEFVAPLRDFRHLVLERVFRRCPDPALATVAYLASEGLVHAKLTDPQAYDPDERGRVFEALERLLDAQAAPEPAPR